MKFEWDENKNNNNRQKHNIDFADAVRVFDGFYITRKDLRFDYGEIRYETTGVLDDNVVVVIHTSRRTRCRLISVRRASREERTDYYEQKG